MKFIKVEPNENYPIARMISENGVYELGLTPMLYGVRVRAGAVGNWGLMLDYCAGPQEEEQIKLLMAIMVILESRNEEDGIQEVFRDFPRQNVKPMYNDPDCWNEIKQLIKESLITSEYYE